MQDAYNSHLIFHLYNYNLNLQKEKKTYHCLHHIHPLLSDFLHSSRYIYYCLSLYLLQHMVNGNEDTSTTDSSTEGRDKERSLSL